jgi:transposase
MSESKAFDLVSRDVGPLPIVNHFLERLRLSSLLTEHLPGRDPRAKVQPVEAIGVLVRNLVLSRVPLYSQAEWAHRTEPSLLGLTPEQLSFINDDRLGRALDRLFDADRSVMLTEFVVHMVREFEVEMEQFHNDSTTITLHGEYKNATGRPMRGKPTLVITFGHNKDHRPDLKQLLWILTVSADGAVPVHFKVGDGNTEDSTTHVETWNLLRKLVGHPRFLYVADCKLCTRENLRYIHSEKGWFITVVPKSRKEDRLFRDWLQTNTPAWEEIARKPHPRLVEGPPEIIKAIESPIPDPDGFRLVWVFSSAKRERDFLARKGTVELAWKELEDLRLKLEGPRCRVKTRHHVAKLVEAILERTGARRWLDYQIDVVQNAAFRQEKRGRSGPKTRWRRTLKARYRLSVTPNTANIEYDSRCDGIFPLITNRERSLLPLRALVDAYKAKQPMIEKRHDLLKNVQAAAPALLKNVGRIEALLFVHYIALTVSALIERELRRAMSAHRIKELPLYPERRRCKAPTADRVFEIFGSLQRHYLSRNGETVQTFHPELTAMQQRLLELLEVPTEAYEAL